MGIVYNFIIEMSYFESEFPILLLKRDKFVLCDTEMYMFFIIYLYSAVTP